jgi:ATP-dependent Clp protease ATP-binding subunit ClpC
MLWSDVQTIRAAVRDAAPDVNTNRLTDYAIETLLAAIEHGKARGDKRIEPEHILLAIVTPVRQRVVQHVLKRLCVDLPGMTADVATLFPDNQAIASDGWPPFGAQTARLFSEAKAESHDLGHNYICSQHLALGMLRFAPCDAGEVLRRQLVTLDRFRQELFAVIGRPEPTSPDRMTG